MLLCPSLTKQAATASIYHAPNDEVGDRSPQKQHKVTHTAGLYVTSIKRRPFKIDDPNYVVPSSARRVVITLPSDSDADSEGRIQRDVNERHSEGGTVEAHHYGFDITPDEADCDTEIARDMAFSEKLYGKAD